MSKKLYAFYIKNPDQYRFYDVISEVMNTQFENHVSLYAWTTDKQIKSYFIKSRNMDLFYMVKRDISSMTEDEFEQWMNMYSEYQLQKSELRHYNDEIFIPYIGPQFEYMIFLSALPFLYEYIMIYSYTGNKTPFPYRDDYDSYTYIDTLKREYSNALYNIRVDLLIDIDDIYSSSAPMITEYLDEYNIYKYIFGELYQEGVLE